MEKRKLSNKKPPWLRVRLGGGAEHSRITEIIRTRCLHTVCEEALCPNRGECWEKGRATLMILGDVCSRNCSFCGVAGGKPAAPDPGEPRRVAEAVKLMGLRDVVITSVTRDDMPDGGAGIWAETISRIHAAAPGMAVEALIPDFGGSLGALNTVFDERPEVLAHNLETVRRLYPVARSGADFGRSLDVLRRARQCGLIVKSGIMVGLGEKKEEVLELMRETAETGCEIFTIGQYLRPTSAHLPVVEYVEPDVFEEYREAGLEMGFDVVISGPLIRSSYYSEVQDAFVKSALGFEFKTSLAESDVLG